MNYLVEIPDRMFDDDGFLKTDVTAWLDAHAPGWDEEVTVAKHRQAEYEQAFEVELEVAFEIAEGEDALRLAQEVAAEGLISSHIRFQRRSEAEAFKRQFDIPNRLSDDDVMLP